MTEGVEKLMFQKKGIRSRHQRLKRERFLGLIELLIKEKNVSGKKCNKKLT